MRLVKRHESSSCLCSQVCLKNRLTINVSKPKAFHGKVRHLWPTEFANSDTVSISKGDVLAANPRGEHGNHPTRTDHSIGHAVAAPPTNERLRPLGGC